MLRTVLVSVALLAALLVAIGVGPNRLRQLVDGPRTYYVSPTGSDSNRGEGPAAPLATIQLAVDRARPGDQIRLAEGEYRQDVVSRRDGTAAAPITISGPPGAVIRGGGSSRVIEINHDNHTLKGFTVNGLWGRADRAAGYRDKLLYAVGTRPGDGVVGLRVLEMSFANAGGECLRLRYHAMHNEVAYSSIAGCGLYDFRFGGGGKNGEGIYIGTARGQLGDGRNPTAELDTSGHNWIHDNSIDTGGGECVDIKEGARENLVERNSCTGQRDPKSAGLAARGDRNTLRDNKVYGNSGAGVRLGGAEPGDGVANRVYGNTLVDNRGGGIKILRPEQGPLCGNLLRDNGQGAVVGSDLAVDPAAPCAEP